ncbi:hypothetical protein O6R05_02730 [Peptoniphilus equinus]|uniref:Uncharacterized protein n=1 Tax=Peptoniphilus equinus TaxID=3016343 RepID=A0ABY7QUM5_9FIRM|nr:hypothetical protein [Peptoniphilus equinus]WBW50477.1 hypothetical protein O6R05_02730 [Peptoniphilus equinus]
MYNVYGEMAIDIELEDGAKRVTYLSETIVFYRLMDACKELFEEVSKIAKLGTWTRIYFKNFLHE